MSLPNNMEIIPSVLAKNPEELADIKNKLGFVRQSLHIDIADGQFVPTITVGREEIAQAFGRIPLHVHLMVATPEHVVPLWLDMPNLASIIFHIEASDKAPEIIDTIHQAGKKAGVAINPETDAALLEPLISKADYVHFMTVHPGNYGAAFQQSVVEKITALHAAHPDVFISADGGITPENIEALKNAGAMACIVGSYILRSDNPEKAFNDFKL